MSQMCRTYAYEAQRRGAAVNVHELWALLERVEQLHPSLILDVGSGPAMLWTWWALGARVVGVHPGDAGAAAFMDGRLPELVTVIDGDPIDRVTVRRAVDQLADVQPDVVVLAGMRHEGEVLAAYEQYAPMVRRRGLVVVHGIESTPGVRRFWRNLHGDKDELVGGTDPLGYGIVDIHGRDRADHG